MKTKSYLLIAAAGLLFASCSSDDSSGDTTPTNFTIPLTDGKYWTYDVTGEAGDTRDSLYVAGDTLIGSTTYKRLEVRDNIATGFYSSSLRNNGVRQVDTKLLLTGDLSLSAGDQLPIDLDLSLLDFTIFKSNATNGEILATKTGTIQQTVQGYPLTIHYTLKSKGGESIPNYTSPNTDAYTDVKTSQIVLNASITTVQDVGGFPITITVLADQTVLTSTQYIANNIGVVYTNTVTSYTINETIATQLGVPSSDSQTQEEFLDTHN
nr:hypothetical protein [uncultured Flavobacterium sp.]